MGPKADIQRLAEWAVTKIDAVTDWELWAVANTVLRQHGEGAADFVARRIRDLDAKGDDPGCVVWGLILSRIAELQRVEPGKVEAVHWPVRRTWLPPSHCGQWIASVLAFPHPLPHKPIIVGAMPVSLLASVGKLDPLNKLASRVCMSPGELKRIERAKRLRYDQRERLGAAMGISLRHLRPGRGRCRGCEDALDKLNQGKKMILTEQFARRARRGQWSKPTSRLSKA